MDKFFATIIAAAAIIGGATVLSGVVALQQSGEWSPRDYVVHGDGCIVYPQGDPLYDEHYAKNVNIPNCQAYTMQEAAQYTQATTRALNWDTNGAIVGVGSIFLVVVSILGLLLVAVFRM